MPLGVIILAGHKLGFYNLSLIYPVYMKYNETARTVTF